MSAAAQDDPVETPELRGSASVRNESDSENDSEEEDEVSQLCESPEISSDDDAEEPTPLSVDSKEGPSVTPTTPLSPEEHVSFSPVAPGDPRCIFSITALRGGGFSSDCVVTLLVNGGIAGIDPAIENGDVAQQQHVKQSAPWGESVKVMASPLDYIMITVKEPSGKLRQGARVGKARLQLMDVYVEERLKKWVDLHHTRETGGAMGFMGGGDETHSVLSLPKGCVLLRASLVSRGEVTIPRPVRLSEIFPPENPTEFSALFLAGGNNISAVPSAGERILMAMFDATLSQKRGTLYLTEFRIIFLHVSADGLPASPVSIPIANIATAEAQYRQGQSLFKIKTADGFTAEYLFSGNFMQRLQWVASEIEWRRMEDTFVSKNDLVNNYRDPVGESQTRKITENGEPLERRRSSTVVSRQISKSSIDLRDEMTRIIENSPSGGEWRATAANSNYQLCSSYPSLLYIPSRIDDKILFEAASQRAKGRIPALSWLHPHSGAALCRSSQPLNTQRKGKTISADEELLLSLSLSLSDRKPLSIIDCRPMVSAEGNAVMGKGYENIERLGGGSVATLQFMGIENIHHVRHSLAALRGAGGKTEGFNTAVDASLWLSHIQIILKSSLIIVRALEQGSSVLVHCSDGWDRTAQCTALSQIIADGHCRTLRGFAALIEKEFSNFGHRFDARNQNPSHGKASPVFIQFLDCVWQIMRQFPRHFEFSENLLLELATATYSRWYRNFKYNSERERNAHAHETCFWEILFLNRFKYLSHLPPLAKPKIERSLEVDVGASSIRLWRAYHLQEKDPLLEGLKGQLEEQVWLLQALGKVYGPPLGGTLKYLYAQRELDIRNENRKICELSPLSADLAGTTSEKHEIVRRVLADSSAEKEKEKEKLKEILFERWLSPKRDERAGSPSTAQSAIVPVWVPDSTCRSCMMCTVKFSLTTRKHHCRSCGGIFCSACASNTLRLPRLGFNSPVRVCNKCARALS